MGLAQPQGTRLDGESDDTELLFSGRLADTVAADFKKIAPIYDFLIKAESSRRE